MNIKKNIYPKLALTGMVKNKRTYVPYLMTCICMIFVSYLLNFLRENKRISEIRGGSTLQAMLSLGSGIFCIFALIFLFYTNSFLIKRRKREFGLYNILGMGKRNIAGILVCESALMLGISLVGGLGLGILFSKLGELCMIKVLGGEISYAFSVEISTVLETVILFAVIFGLILLNSLRQIRMSDPIELADGVPEDGTVYTPVFTGTNGQVVTVEEGENKVVYLDNQLQRWPHNFYAKGTLTVTKKLLGADGEAKDSDEVFYAGIFDDPEYTTLSERVEYNLLELDMSGGSETSMSTNVQIESLDSVTTLYVTEVDEDGNPVKGAPGFAYEVSVDKTEVNIDPKHTKAEVTITNKEKSYEGRLTVTKKLVTEDGKAKESDETFYAGIFDDADFTKLSKWEELLSLQTKRVVSERLRHRLICLLLLRVLAKRCL